MFASLRFPDAAHCAETRLPDSEEWLIGRFLREKITREDATVAAKYAVRIPTDSQTRRFRLDLATELFVNPSAEQILKAFVRAGRTARILRSTCTDAASVLRLPALTEHFAKEFDKFLEFLPETDLQSTALRKFRAFCRAVAESFEYRNLKSRARDLRNAAGCEFGFTKSEFPKKGEDLCLLRKESNKVDGVWNLTRGAAELFGKTEESDRPVLRPYSESERAVLAAWLQSDPKTAKRIAEFADAYAASPLDDLIRLSEEAQAVCAWNDFCKSAQKRGYPVSRPTMREPGFYCEIFGIGYETGDKTVAEEDFSAFEPNHITAVCGPDAAEYIDALRLVFLSASGGGLILARGGEISPVTRIDADNSPDDTFPEGDETVVQLYTHAFDRLTPRREESELCKAVAREADKNAIRVFRVGAKSSADSLKKKSDLGFLPHCTVRSIGKDPSLNELLHRTEHGKESSSDVD